jgi:hypothetical protein
MLVSSMRVSLPFSRRPRAALLLVCLGLLAGCQAAANAQNGNKPARQGRAPAAPPALPKPATKPAAQKPTATKPASPAPQAKGTQARANESSPLGTNLDGINDWSPDWAFVDAMKRSREWISSPEHTWEDQQKLDLDARGYVRSLKKGQRARTLIWWETPHYPGGDYVVLYEGAGTLQYDPQGDVRAKRAGREVVRLNPKDNFSLLVSALPKPSNYLKDLHVIMPGGVCSNDALAFCDDKTPCKKGGQCTAFEQNHETQIFHPKFLERVSKFSTLRFMDWMKTNESKEKKWADRPLPTDVRFREGVPLETMVALCNRLSQNAWLNIPHAADDDYVRKFATYVRDNLRPELKVYVEWSNEVWNGIFPQASYAVEQGKKLGLGKSDWDAQYRYHSRRSTEVHKIWESVFKGQMQRVVRVLGTQVANEGVAEALLQFGDTKDHVDALAVAPYFAGEYGGPDDYKKWEDKSVDDVIADIRARSLPIAAKYTRTHAEIVKKYKLTLIAYEGGESFSAMGPGENSDKLNKLFDAVGRDPRMKQLYLEYLKDWKDSGGQLFMHFTDCYSPGKYGRWGALEYLEQPRAEAPKFDALMTFIENNPRWW